MNSERDYRDGVLERYLLGELPEEELAHIRQALEADGALRKRLEALEQSNRQILAAYPADGIGRAIEGRMGDEVESGNVVFFPVGWAVSAAAVILIAALLAWRPEPVRDMIAFFKDQPLEEVELVQDNRDLEGVELTRVKGVPRLILYRQMVAGGEEELKNSSLVQEGDLIQIVYQSAGQPYGVIFSIDGWGKVTRHLPDVGDRAARLKTGQPDTLKFSYQLDDAPRWERFYFITSNSPFEIAPVLTEARKTAAEGVPKVSDSFKRFIFTLHKEPM